MAAGRAEDCQLPAKERKIPISESYLKKLEADSRRLKTLIAETETAASASMEMLLGTTTAEITMRHLYQQKKATFSIHCSISSRSALFTSALRSQASSARPHAPLSPTACSPAWTASAHL
jgi:hypothetical protein